MADTKLSALPALAGTGVAAGDLLYIDDVSAGTAGSKSVRADNTLLALLATSSTGVVSPENVPTVLAADTNNWSPGVGMNQKVAASTAVNVTGMVAGTAGEIRIIQNVAINAVTLVRESGSSTAANRFVTGNSYNIRLGGLSSPTAGESALAVYDAVTARWLVWKLPGVTQKFSGNILLGAGQSIEDDGNARLFVYDGATSAKILIASGVIEMASDQAIKWESGTSIAGANDTGLVRTAAGVVKATNGGAGSGWVTSPAGKARTTSQFDKPDTTLANITGLSVTLLAGRTYKFLASLPVTADAVGGYKVAMAGTATATTIYYDVTAETTGVAPSLSRQTALAGAASGSLGTTVRIWLEGVITVNAAGTLTAQFAQSTATGTSSVLIGADLFVDDVT